MFAARGNSNDPFIGYYASIAIALLISSVLAFQIVDGLNSLTSIALSDAWRVCLEAGLFLGITFANPVNTVSARKGYPRAAARLGAGFVLGALLQFFILTPIAGNGMSKFLLLLLAGSMVPAILVVDHLRAFLNKRAIEPVAQFIDGVDRILDLPERVLFLLLMGTSFALFWRFAPNPSYILATLAFVLFGLTVWVSLRESQDDYDQDPEEAEKMAWLALDPFDDAPQWDDSLRTRLKSLGLGLLPGAILFGGMTRLAVDFLLMVYPNLHTDFSDPMSALQSMGIVAASGLGVVFFGMMGALGFGLLVIRLIGWHQRWSRAHLRENCVHLIRAMYFRPMDRRQAT